MNLGASPQPGSLSRQRVLDEIRRALSKLGAAHVEKFEEGARLNQELYLDSVLMLQLFLHLELELGCDVPESALTEPLPTVAALADFVLGLPLRVPRPERQDACR